MALRVSCTSCGAEFRLADEMAGKKVRCKHCSTIFAVDASGSASMGVQPPPRPTPRVQERTEDRSTPEAKSAHDVRRKNGATGDRPLPVAPRRSRALLWTGIAASVLAAGGVGAFLLLSGTDQGPVPVQGAAPEPKKQEEQVRRVPADDFHLTEARKSIVVVKCFLPGLPPATGSGFLVSKDGLVYTNRHVIDFGLPNDDRQILVGVPARDAANKLDYFKAEVVFSTTPRNALDFAILKITAKPEYGEFTPLALAQEMLDLGNPTAALGYPVGVQGDVPTLSFNKGSVSAAKVMLDKVAFYQTDAAVNPGNSGGPLINQRGEAVGIVTLKKTQAQNMGYAIYLSEALQAADKIEPQKVADTRPEPGPLDPNKVLQAKGNPPRRESWEVVQGVLREHNHSLTIDNNGAHYWMASKEVLPEHFQATIKCGVEFLRGNQTIFNTQRIILRTLCVTFGSTDIQAEILEGKNGYAITFSHQFINLRRQGQVLHFINDGNPDEPFLLTVTRLGQRITVAVNNEIILDCRDPEPLPGRARLQIGGFLSRLNLGEVTILPLEGPAIVAKNEPGKDPGKKDPGKKDPGAKDVAAKSKDVVVSLPAAAADLVVAAGGKYLALALPAAAKVVIVDPLAGKIVKEIPANDNDAKLAAGADKLLILLPASKVVQRWDLKTLEREAIAPWPYDCKVRAMAMGASSSGPLLVTGQDLPGNARGIVLDPMTLKRLPIFPNAEFENLPYLAAAGNGQFFTIWSHVGGMGRSILKLEKDDIKVQTFPTINGYLAPTEDGSHFLSSTHWDKIFNHSGVVYRENFKVVLYGKDAGFNRLLFPAQTGHYFLDLRPDERKPGRAFLQLLGEPEPFDVLEDLDIRWPDLNDLALSPVKRVLFLPVAKSVVLVPSKNSRLVIRRVDADDLMVKSGKDYLVVTSAAPREAERASPYSYQVKVLSRDPKITYKLEASPPEMMVTKEGLITWTVPANFTLPTADVILSVRNDAGREVLHSFQISVPEGKKK